VSTSRTQEETHPKGQTLRQSLDGLNYRPMPSHGTNMGLSNYDAACRPRLGAGSVIQRKNCTADWEGIGENIRQINP